MFSQVSVCLQVDLRIVEGVFLLGEFAYVGDLPHGDPPVSDI